MKTHIFVSLVFLVYCCNNVPAQTSKKTNDPVTILERSKANDSSSTGLKINEDYFQNIEMEEKAALGLLSTFISSDCTELRLQGKMVGLSCKLTSLLGYKYQCSNEQLSFLRHWFREDTATLNLLTQGACNINPTTAPIQESFTSIAISKAKNKIVIKCNISGIDAHTAKSRTRQETLHFVVDSYREQIRLQKREQKTLSRL